MHLALRGQADREDWLASLCTMSQSSHQGHMLHSPAEGERAAKLYELWLRYKAQLQVRLHYQTPTGQQLKGMV